MTKIEWTEKTWNPVVGCSIVSPAKVLVGGYGHGPDGWKLFVAVEGRETAAAEDFDAAKRLIDEVAP